MGRQEFGILTAIVCGSSALLPFWGTAPPSSSTVFTRKPIFDSVETGDAQDRDLPCNRFRVAMDDGHKDFLENSSAEATLRYKVELLDQGLLFLKSAGGYTAKMQKQEVVRGNLLDEQTISIKCRNQPFSVYLLWLSGDTGREVLYIDGSHDGKMIAHDGGWKARIPAFSLSTDGSLAMRDARYPVTLAGLQGLIDTMQDVHREDLSRSSFQSCVFESERAFIGRPCYVFTTKYKSPADSPIYRKSVTYIDHEWNVPIHSRHFEWPVSRDFLDESQLDEATLVESYSFADLSFHQNFTDYDFDRANPEYHFH